MAEVLINQMLRDKRGVRWTPELIEVLRQIYPTTLNKEIASYFGIAETAIRAAARRFGLQKDPDWRRNYLVDLAKKTAVAHAVKNGKRNGPLSRRLFFDEQYFSGELTPESAYWLGFIQADGSIHIRPRCRYLTISLGIHDAKHLDQFMLDIQANRSAKRYFRKIPVATVSLVSKPFIEDLMRIGIQPDKTRLGTFPVIEGPMVSHYLRGVFDGDGSIHFRHDRNCDPSISIAGGEDFALWALNTIRKHTGIKGGSIIQHQTRHVWYVVISGRIQVTHVFYWLYRNATRWLERKRQVFACLYGGDQ